MLQTEKIVVTTTGADGAATGTAYSSRPISGAVKRIIGDWGATAPNTSDIAITVEADDKHPATTLYSKANAVTDFDIYPLVQGAGADGALITGQYVPPIVEGRVSVAVVQCNALAVAITVTVIVETG